MRRRRDVRSQLAYCVRLGLSGGRGRERQQCRPEHDRRGWWRATELSCDRWRFDLATLRIRTEDSGHGRARAVLTTWRTRPPFPQSSAPLSASRQCQEPRADGGRPATHKGLPRRVAPAASIHEPPPTHAAASPAARSCSTTASSPTASCTRCARWSRAPVGGVSRGALRGTTPPRGEEDLTPPVAPNAPAPGPGRERAQPAAALPPAPPAKALPRSCEGGTRVEAVNAAAAAYRLACQLADSPVELWVPPLDIVVPSAERVPS